MDKAQLKSIILENVNSSSGIKSVQLMVQVQKDLDVLKLRMSSEEFESTLAELVEERDMVEINYVVPRMDYREKTMYFPSGTSLRLSGVKEVPNAEDQLKKLRASRTYAEESERRAPDLRGKKWWTKEVLKLQMQINDIELNKGKSNERANCSG